MAEAGRGIRFVTAGYRDLFRLADGDCIRIVKADISIRGFEDADFPDCFFDVAVGNVPFGNYRPPDRRYDKENLLIHDYFFASQVSIANQGVLALQREKNALMKSTAVVLYIMGNRAVWAHVGDSRLYYVHEGRIKACTEDHSVAYKKYKTGEITKREIAFDEDQPRLLRAIGGEDHSEPVIRVYEELLSPGDGFFLCTDGAWEFLDDEEIAIDLLKSSHARQWTEYLLMRMMDRIKPGNDNLTVLSVILNYDKTYTRRRGLQRHRNPSPAAVP